MRPNVELDEFVLMPNHIHGIVVITKSIGRGVLQYAPTTHALTMQYILTMQCIPTNQRSTRLTTSSLRSPSQTIGAIIRGFKSAVTARINKCRNTPGAKIWQRNYYERIIRNDDELNRIREYIVNNPAQWESDREKPVPYWKGDIHE
jgi:REP element-mobilizing transposase RayT